MWIIGTETLLGKCNVMKEEKIDLVLSSSILVIGIIILLSVGGEKGWMGFGLISLIASLVMLQISDTDIGLYSSIMFWIISEIALVKGVIDFTDNNLYGLIIGIVVFLIVIIPIYIYSND